MSECKRPPHVSAECLPGAGESGVCDRCRSPLEGRRRRWCSDECAQAYFGDHVFGWSRHRARERDGNRCVNGCEKTWDGVEVDHIEAAEGRHGQHACVHHLDNLRCLCPPCHRKRTAEQRKPKPAQVESLFGATP